MKRCNLSRQQNIDSDSADVTSSGRSFQICELTTGKARLPTVDSLTGGTTGVPTQRKDRRPSRQVSDANDRSEILRCLYACKTL